MRIAAFLIIAGWAGPASATGLLKVTSFPDGAAISVDGAPLGTATPTSISLSEGTHTVQVTAGTGWTTASRQVVIGSGVSNLSVTLLPMLTTGPQGPEGPRGPAGESVIGQSLEEGNEVCPAGGTRFIVGGEITYACNGEEGPPGEQGIQGIQGIRGLQGEVGPEGPEGPSGSLELPFEKITDSADPAFYVTNQGTGDGVKAFTYGTGASLVGYNRDLGAGVVGQSVRGIGVYGDTLSTFGYGVKGAAGPGTAVYGQTYDGIGVLGQANDLIEGTAGKFIGKVLVEGNMIVTGNLSKGGGSFKIDHPLDPTNKYLYHSFVESPDMMNIYNGNATLGATGEVVVELPDWFDALNRDFRYQVTSIGGFAPLYVARKVEENRFTIAGGNPGQEVSWQVTGIRRDGYANAHRIPVEEMKPAGERGHYLYPEAARNLKPRN